ncbi:probable transcriptional regulatory protein Teth514_1449, partial [Teleopsis dalmanni]|uniref:probable transcriptional regulatory protein Teth514_1449 n=1 Tax=Teleopsis dalmanni TaxID=139649 RepID=UPI0018CF9EF8
MFFLRFGLTFTKIPYDVVNKSKLTFVTRCFRGTYGPLLAGHSKWANIKHTKAQKDGQKSTTFTKFSRQIRIAIQEGSSSDPAMNSQLRRVIQEALRNNMPMSSIQTTIAKSAQKNISLKKYLLEIQYKKKVFMVCVLNTDNFAGNKMEISTILNKHGAVFADIGNLFDDFGLIETTVDLSNPSLKTGLEDLLIEDAISCGADDYEIVDDKSGFVRFFCDPDKLRSVTNAIEAKGYSVENTEHKHIAQKMILLTPDEETLYKKFKQKLENINDIEIIYDNIE